MNRLRIGCHLSSSKGFLAMGQTAVKIGANTFQFFTRNPRGGAAKPLDLADVEAFNEYARNHDIKPILAHAPYILNPCAADAGLREFAVSTMKDDLKRLSYIPGAMYNFHPGSHVKQGVDVGIDYIVSALNAVLEDSDYETNGDRDSGGNTTTVLLETMAGKGSEIGRSFEELRRIIDKVEQKERLGVCLDTCHVFDGGYDIVEHLEDVLKEFDDTIGLERLKAVHMNDSKNVLGSHKDRHEKIGEGNIGTEAFARIINHDSLKNLPFYLETPNELDGYQKEIALLRNLFLS